MGPIQLQHGEFRVVLRRQALVAETAVELEYPLETADHQSFQVQLGRDPQVQVAAQGLVPGDERPRRSTAGDRVQQRRLDLQEAALVQQPAQFREQAAAAPEQCARVLVGQQVEVPAAVAELDVVQTVEFLRRRAQRLAQQPQFPGPDGQFAGAGLHQRAVRADDVAQVPAPEFRIGRVAQPLAQRHQLDAPALVLQLDERSLALHALEHHPPGHCQLLSRQRVRRRIVVRRMQLRRAMRRPEVVRPGPARRAQLRQLAAARRAQLLLPGRLAGHGYSPAFRLASRNASRSPSSTVCGAPHSCCVRRSLMRDWSST